MTSGKKYLIRGLFRGGDDGARTHDPYLARTSGDSYGRVWSDQEAADTSTNGQVRRGMVHFWCISRPLRRFAGASLTYAMERVTSNVSTWPLMTSRMWNVHTPAVSVMCSS